MALTYHNARRGFLGFLTYLTGSDGVTRGGVIPAMTLTSSAGVEITSFGGGGDASAANQVIQSTKLDTLHTDLIAPTPAGTNLIGKVGIDQTTPGTTNATAPTAKYLATKATFADTQVGPLNQGSRGALITQLQLPDNANAVGFTGSGSDGAANNTLNCYNSNAFPNVFNGTTWDRQKKPNATGRLLSSAATTNATSVKAAAGDLFKITGNNTTATKRYLKLYNKASAPTVGTDTPVLTFPLPGSAAFDISISPGYYFSAGIAFAITGAAADADTTAVASGDIECINLAYA